MRSLLLRYRQVCTVGPHQSGNPGAWGLRLRCRLQRSAGLPPDGDGEAAGCGAPRAPWLRRRQIPSLSHAAMDGLHEFAHPQQLAGIVAITLLSLAAAIEAVMVRLSLRQATRLRPAEPVAAEAAGQDFYDWLYE